MAPFKLLGLTGGIASGKSTVAAHLRSRGERIAVIDADALYHELIAPQDARPSPLGAAIAELFAAQGHLLDAHGQLERRRLGDIVFNDADARHKLEALTHPAVRRLADARFAQARARGAEVVFYDVPLLFESHSGREFDGVLLVWVPPQVQLQRLMQRNGLDEAAAQARIAAQMSLDSKRERAQWVIDNSGTKAASYAQIDDVLQQLGVL